MCDMMVTAEFEDGTIGVAKVMRVDWISTSTERSIPKDDRPVKVLMVDICNEFGFSNLGGDYPYVVDFRRSA